MGRSERSLGNLETPAEIFAAELRQLRERAGNPTYLKMHRACGKIRSKTALSEAAGGDHLPTWETVEAYVTALGANPADWLRQWEDAQDQERCRRDRGPAPAVAEQVEPGSVHQTPPPHTRLGRRLNGPRTVLHALVVAVTIACVVGVLSIFIVTRPHDVPAQTGPVAVVVQNKVAIGPTTLMEDSTPEYLSARPVPRCAERGCEIRGTTMWSGVIIPVVCQKYGAWMTNEDITSNGIGRNPGRSSSTLWYRAVLPTGNVGYISVVFLQARYRGGMHLPRCR
jgi:hypothetical protein